MFLKDICTSNQKVYGDQNRIEVLDKLIEQDILDLEKNEEVTSSSNESMRNVRILADENIKEDMDDLME